ncbi:unnamed protein product [Bursaphelenchus xylophilus]|uniref:(pine wood nematode) hypothetical protein n=1 Tax=Bursaphelenchus xylophilus TaxID=6326 RepID=A0A1I7SBH6_BURXY|nr:unnamed protein product [Bursaphelenchus xylophilus]CAG9121989.1 unnamed protein product [Bursaphelenchus xylophilus]
MGLAMSLVLKLKEGKLDLDLADKLASFVFPSMFRISKSCESTAAEGEGLLHKKWRVKTRIKCTTTPWNRRRYSRCSRW